MAAKKTTKVNGGPHVLADRFSAHIMRIRVRSGLSQAAVARELGVTPGWVCRLESNQAYRGNPSLATAEKMAKYLDVDPGTLFARIKVRKHRVASKPTAPKA